jgi:hypothetical protein
MKRTDSVAGDDDVGVDAAIPAFPVHGLPTRSDTSAHASITSRIDSQELSHTAAQSRRTGRISASLMSSAACTLQPLSIPSRPARGFRSSAWRCSPAWESPSPAPLADCRTPGSFVRSSDTAVLLCREAPDELLEFGKLAPPLSDLRVLLLSSDGEQVQRLQRRTRAPKGRLPPVWRKATSQHDLTTYLGSC